MKQVCERLSISRSSLYNRIKDGLITPPINIGTTAVRWPDSEIDTLVAAMITGKTKAELQRLVNDLTIQRNNSTPQH
ncbi:helix-turn-helix transcriptional regulator [Oceanimonas smirnovii]|nr:hypothetical protein B6S09_04190 [Oceanimonas baumannii]